MIGVIDSGSGGLSVLLELRREFPSADFLYFGDIKNAPYGEKSHAELSRLTVEALKFLKDNGVSNVVSACNSVSASMAISLFDTLLSSQHIVEMVGPTVQAFAEDVRPIVLCATQATIDSGMYQNAFHMIGKANVTAIPIPDLAGQIEFGADRATIKENIASALAPHHGSLEVLILGCTHYPLVIDLFKEVVGEQVSIIDPAQYVANRAASLFKDELTGTGTVKFVISQDSQPFRDYVAKLLETSTYTIEVLP